MHYAATEIIPRFTKITSYQRLIISIVIILILQEIVIRFVKGHLKKKYVLSDMHNSHRGKNGNYLIYYKKSQRITLFRVVVIILAIVILLSEGKSNVWSFFAIGLGAIVITFQSIIQSLMVYFTILLQYRAGETISIGEIQGEIISIKPLFVGIAGITDNGEHNGKFNIIPNKVILEQGIQKVELRPSSMQKVVMQARYNKKEFGISFDEVLTKLDAFLEDLLPKRDAREVGYFKSYSGHKYKLQFDFANDKECTVIITISFLEKMSNLRTTKRKIVTFLEGIKTV